LAAARRLARGGLIALGLLAAAPGTGPAVAQSDAESGPAVDNGAVVVMYHRFGEGRYPSTNIRMEQFRAHIEELRKARYTVMPLPEIVAALRQDRPLPERAVAITVDDAYLSVYERAWPLLREAGLPFTLFVATQPVEQGLSNYMSWDQIRELHEAGLVTIGSQTHSHPHMPAQSSDANRADLMTSRGLFEEHLGEAPALFAYPFGEYSKAVKSVIRASGFRAAFGQHSGAIGRLTGLFEMPRYAMNESYGGMDRFRLAVNSMPLPVRDVTPPDNKLSADQNPPLYGFTVHPSVGDLRQLNCFASGRGQVDVNVVMDSRVEVRLDQPFPKGRARINCTLPGPDGRWRWFGNQFYVTGR
jgi:peptidoglycan/xylan/chitin deacetylase (PgdA/CDA1 family)